MVETVCRHFERVALSGGSDPFLSMAPNQCQMGPQLEGFQNVCINQTRFDKVEQVFYILPYPHWHGKGTSPLYHPKPSTRLDHLTIGRPHDYTSPISAIESCQGPAEEEVAGTPG